MRGEFLARFGKGLSTDLSGEIGLLTEMGEEGIQFILDAGFEAGEEEDDQGGKRQLSIAAKGFRI